MNGYRKFTGALFKVNDVISKVELLLMSISMVILTAVMSWQVLTRYFIRYSGDMGRRALPLSVHLDKLCG